MPALLTRMSTRAVDLPHPGDHRLPPALRPWCRRRCPRPGRRGPGSTPRTARRSPARCRRTRPWRPPPPGRSAMPPPMLGLVPVTIATFPVSFTMRSFSRRCCAAREAGEQGAGERDEHDDAGHHHRVLELALGDVVELQDRERPVGAGGEQRDVADVAGGAHERDHAHRHQGRRHQAEHDAPIGVPPRGARDARGLLELGAELHQPALDDLHAERHAGNHPGDDQQGHRAVERAQHGRSRNSHSRASPRMMPGTVNGQPRDEVEGAAAGDSASAPRCTRSTNGRGWRPPRCRWPGRSVLPSERRNSSSVRTVVQLLEGPRLRDIEEAEQLHERARAGRTPAGRRAR